MILIHFIISFWMKNWFWHMIITQLMNLNKFVKRSYLSYWNLFGLKNITENPFSFQNILTSFHPVMGPVLTFDGPYLFTKPWLDTDLNPIWFLNWPLFNPYWTLIWSWLNPTLTATTCQKRFKNNDDNNNDEDDNDTYSFKRWQGV